MKTRFTPLIKVKKELMERCERDLQQANQSLRNAETAVEEAYQELELAKIPATGSMTEFQSSRVLITAQREIIKEKQEWHRFAKDQVEKAKVSLKNAMVEYEKFKYLEAEEIKQALIKERQREQRELDEIAVQISGRLKGTA